MTKPFLPARYLTTTFFPSEKDKEQIFIYESKTGVGNSFGFAGHMRGKLGIRRPVYVLVN